jgi:cation-transporting P-type ATPase E
MSVYLGAMLIFDCEAGLARTLLLCTLIPAGVGNAVVATGGSRPLVLWAGFAVAVLLTVKQIPLSAYFFALEPLTAIHWGVVALAGAGAVIAPMLFSGGGVREDGNR